ncbi:hypothetical protein Godav_025514, partial [Gossypium davidsonii]|nr:hypothetical protein [Gossypium davidsonii]
DLILAHPDTKKRVEVFALSIYGLVIFPKALGHIDDAVSDLFDQIDKNVTPVPVILVETFRSLSACWRVGEDRFIGCAQLLLAWFYSHFWKVENVSYQVFSENYSLLKEFTAIPKRDNISEEKWIAILQRAVGYGALAVLRQYRSRKFIPTTQWLAQCEFAYKCDNYKKKVREISNTWNQSHKMKSFAANPVVTFKYYWWWGKRVNDNVSISSQENTQPIEEHLQVIPSELEIIKQDFEKRSSELGKKIE